MKKLIIFVSALMCAAVASMCACVPSDNADDTFDNEPSAQFEYTTLVNNAELVVFTAHDVPDDMTWKDYFDGLAESGLITYKMSGTMLSELNGSVNGVSAHYWMLYSDIVELDGVIYGNAEWGTYDYEGKQLVSCSFGLELMPVAEGYTYAAVYQALEF